MKRDYRKRSKQRWIARLLRFIEARGEVSLSEASEYLNLAKSNISTAMRSNGTPTEYRQINGRINAIYIRRTSEN